MTKISKYVNLQKDILLEYVYDDSNLIGDPYDVLVNSKNQNYSYVAGDTSGTNNVLGNQLFNIDPIANKYGKVDTTYYSFLNLKNYGSSVPVRHDTINIHVPINYTFGEYLGFYMRVYAFDYTNNQTYDLSNFYFDQTDVSQQGLLSLSSPPLLFQEKLWGKYVQIEIPAVGVVSGQRVNGYPIANSINANLTNGIGLSITAPIFIEFQFITAIQTINGVTTYLTTPKIVTTVPQTPEFEQLGVVIQESTQGDFFEIFGTYNGTIGEFNQFINNSSQIGNNYYVQYSITIYEQNILGKTNVFTVTNDFDEPVEYRPIIKYSTTTAIIDVEMQLIDAVDNSTIIRNASYGMLQDEVSKYSLSLTKINLRNANKPKIYNIKSAIDPSLVGSANALGVGLGSGSMGNSSNNVVIQTVQVPFPVLIDRFNIIAKSQNVRFNNTVFYGIGKLQIVIYPFDNIVYFVIATGDSTNPKYMDLSNMGIINLVIRNDQLEMDFSLYTDTGEINLAIGQIVFKITQNKFNDIKRIYESGITVFYITSTSQNITTVIYTGLFMIYDSLNNINNLNADVNAAQAVSSQQQSIIPDSSATSAATAIVTRQIVTSPNSNIPKNISPIVNLNSKNTSSNS